MTSTLFWPLGPRGGLLLWALAILLAGCSPDPSPAPPPSETGKGATATSSAAPDQSPAASIVAKIGPFQITRDEVLRLSADREKAAHPINPASSVATLRRNIRKAYLEEMVNRRLLVLGALQYPEWVTDASCEREVQSQLTTLGPEEVERRRRLAGVSKDDFMGQFRRFVREELMKREILRRKVEEQSTVTDEEVQQRYERDREKVFHRPDSWAVYHIDQFLPREKAADLPSVREKLEGLRAQASDLVESATVPQARADLFAPMVREHSQAPDAKTGYAYIYDTPDVKFDPEFVKRVKSSTLGEFSPVFDLAGDDKTVGTCFFLAFEKKDGVYTPFERAKKLIRSDLIKEKRESLRKALLEKLRNEYKVQVWEEPLFQGIDDTAGR